jgi:hypothetical protein
MTKKLIFANKKVLVRTKNRIKEKIRKFLKEILFSKNKSLKYI